MGPLLHLLFWLVSPPQAAGDHWARRYAGGEGVALGTVIPTADCGWLASGSNAVSWPTGEDDWDAWIMKLDASGAIEWSRAYGGDHAEGAVTLEVGDGGYVSVGNSTSFGPAPGLAAWPWVVRLDATGSIEWQMAYEPTALALDAAGPTRDDCVLTLLTGGLRLLKLRATTGEEVWLRQIGQPFKDHGSDLLRTSEGGFVVVGSTDSHNADGNDDLWLVKLDSFGELEWQKAYSSPLEEWPSHVRQTADGGYVVAALINLSAGEDDLAVLRLDAHGEMLWQKRLDFPGLYEAVRDVASATDGGVLVAVQTADPGTLDPAQMHLVKLDSWGNVRWVREYGVRGDTLVDTPVCLEPQSDGGVLVGAVTSSFSNPQRSEAWLLRLDSEGLVGGGGCSFTRNDVVVELPLDYQVVETHAEVASVSMQRIETTVAAYDLPITVVEQCSAPSCLGARCGWVEAIPDPVCEGTDVTLDLGLACGEGALSIGWDLDGDTIADEQGRQISVVLPPGTHEVTAIVTDSCADPGPGRCEARGTVTVLSSDPPGEVSGAGEPPLLVAPGGVALQVEGDPDVTAYNVYSDRLGSWYEPSAATGSACGITDWTDLPGGRVELDYEVPQGSWVLVTGSTPCAEGTAGPRSDGRERTTLGSWELCGPHP